jgi:ATP-dependent exoDNAse (exonuclease V) beta subunit
MDRVVIDTDTVTVLDYKTGEEKDTYSDQINGYIAILQDLYPERTIHGGLAYIDRKILRMVR